MYIVTTTNWYGFYLANLVWILGALGSTRQATRVAALKTHSSPEETDTDTLFV